MDTTRELEIAIEELTAVIGDNIPSLTSTHSSVVNFSAACTSVRNIEGPTPVSLATWVSLVVFLMHAWPDRAIELTPALYLGSDKSGQHPVSPEVLSLVEEGVERMYPDGIIIERCYHDPEPPLQTTSGTVTKIEKAVTISARRLISTRAVWRTMTGGSEDPYTAIQCQWSSESPLRILISSLNELVWKPLQAIKSFQMALGEGSAEAIRACTIRKGFGWRRATLGARVPIWKRSGFFPW